MDKRERHKSKRTALVSFNLCLSEFDQSRSVGILSQLPAWFAIVTAGPTFATVFVATATATAVTTTTAAAAVATAATTVTAAAVATAGTAIGSRASFVNRKVAPFKILAVELFNCRCGLFRRGHLDETEASRAAGHAIFDHLRRFNISCLREMLAQIITSCLEGEVSYIKFRSHFRSIL
jgi:hypothetical protein